MGGAKPQRTTEGPPRDGRPLARAHGARAVSGRPSTASVVVGDLRARARRQAPRHRRAVRGNPRAARRLHHHRRQGSRRSAGDCRAHSPGQNQHGRSPAGSGRRAVMKIVAALAVVVIGFAGFVTARPSHYRVTRTVTMAAPASTVFAEVNDFHRWGAWNPWAKLDPAMKQSFEGAPAGPGAIYTWAGNREVGQGRMTVTESRPSELVRINLEFLKPFAATSTAEFTF